MATKISEPADEKNCEVILMVNAGELENVVQIASTTMGTVFGYNPFVVRYFSGGGFILKFENPAWRDMLGNLERAGLLKK